MARASIISKKQKELKTSANPLLNTQTETLDGKEKNDLDLALKFSLKKTNKANI